MHYPSAKGDPDFDLYMLSVVIVSKKKEHKCNIAYSCNTKLLNFVLNKLRNTNRVFYHDSTVMVVHLNLHPDMFFICSFLLPRCYTTMRLWRITSFQGPAWWDWWFCETKRLSRCFFGSSSNCICWALCPNMFAFPFQLEAVDPKLY